MIIVRDSEGRSLWIMSDAEALMIKETDGSITWARYSDAPMDCADMIRHLLPWAQGETPLTEEELAERAAAVQRVYTELGRYTLAGMEPLQERTDTTPPFWAALQSRAPAACFAATAYFGTEEMSADLRYERLYWNGDSPRSVGSESYTLCRSFYAASTTLTDVKVGGHDGFITDISGFAGRRLVWYDEDRDLLFSLVASHVRTGQIAGTFSGAELIAMAESVAPERFIPAPSTAPDPPPARELWGADALRQYYYEKAETDADHDYSRMDLSVLSGIASGTYGTAADTEELTIDVVGALVAGNTTEIILRVTAKQLDSLLYDNGMPALKNYRFEDVTAVFSRQTFGNNDCTIGFWYTYSEDDPRLAPNQLELHYIMNYQERIDQDHYAIPLTNFGYYDPTSPGFVTLYKDTWSVDIALDPASDFDRRIPLGEEINTGEYRFTVDSVLVTPLACTFRLTCEEEEKYTNDHMDDIFRVCADGRDTISLTLSDGTVLAAGELNIVGGGGARQYPLILSYTLSFHGPMDPSDVRSLSLFGSTFSLP